MAHGDARLPVQLLRLLEEGRGDVEPRHLEPTYCKAACERPGAGAEIEQPQPRAYDPGLQQALEEGFGKARPMARVVRRGPAEIDVCSAHCQSRP
jgi:hypothetical protein